MNTNTPKAETTMPDAVHPAFMNYGAEAPAFALNPNASKQDLPSWCVTESHELQHLANVGQNEFFAGDALLTVQQLGGRLHVFSGILEHLAVSHPLPKTPPPTASQPSVRTSTNNAGLKAVK